MCIISEPDVLYNKDCMHTLPLLVDLEDHSGDFVVPIVVHS